MKFLVLLAFLFLADVVFAQSCEDVLSETYLHETYETHSTAFYDESGHVIFLETNNSAIFNLQNSGKSENMGSIYQDSYQGNAKFNETGTGDSRFDESSDNSPFF